MLRLPDGMRDRIKAAAEKNNRSMNAEIVAALEEKYPPPADRIPFNRVTELLTYLDAANTEDETAKRLDEVNSELQRIGLQVRWSGRMGFDYGSSGWYVTQIGT